jgi:Raf kinase inhibitor-like YbhB/YbcL family protein
MRCSDASSALIGVIVGLSLVAASRITASADPNKKFTLSSTSFVNGARIPDSYTCSGANKSPPLQWSGIPKGTRSIALVVDDPDAPIGTFVHWVFYNLPATSTGLPEGVGPTVSVDGGQQGINGRGEIGYTAPCPPPGKPHHYHFHLYALDRKLDMEPGAAAAKVEAALQGHVLGRSELVGMFARSGT